ncbi:MAG: hypothetical protein H6744_02750 [Deltaproteobacteria bacterium]|nr:hypothetical protein [Deltaproteobacteria bacterium]
MVENVDDLTVNYEEGGITTVEELDKAILTRGTWTTILFKYREFDAKTQEMGKVKFTLRRYQKRSGSYRQQAKFNISSEDQARAIVETLAGWLDG